MYKLKYLTILTSSKVKFKCTYVENNVFKEINQIVDQNTLLSCLGFKIWFNVHTDARDFQPVVIISQ